MSRPGWAARHPVPRISSGIPEGITVTEYHAQGVRVRAYHPNTAPTTTLLWIHGGGFIAGVPEFDDKVCGYLASLFDAVVLSPDYRLASIAPYPAALDDCFTTLTWAFNHAEFPSTVIVAGDSAGGGLAACLVQRAVDSGIDKISCQLLIEPMLDNTTGREPGRGVLTWGWPENMLAWRAYLRGTTVAQSDYAVAARRRDLSALPPTFIAVGELDLFYEEARCYAARLSAAGVPTTLRILPGVYHGVLNKFAHTTVLHAMWEAARQAACKAARTA